MHPLAVCLDEGEEEEEEEEREVKETEKKSGGLEDSFSSLMKVPHVRNASAVRNLVLHIYLFTTSLSL